MEERDRERESRVSVLYACLECVCELFDVYSEVVGFTSDE